jgi:hypothetical protein
MISTPKVKRIFRHSGAKKMSGYGLKRFYRRVSAKLPPEHQGHSVTGMVSTDGRTMTFYACSCGATIKVQSKA